MEAKGTCLQTVNLSPEPMKNPKRGLSIPFPFTCPSLVKGPPFVLLKHHLNHLKNTVDIQDIETTQNEFYFEDFIYLFK